MERVYWERFVQSGQIEDYLYYKGIGLCQAVMEKYEEKKREADDYSDRNGIVGHSDWRV